MINTHMGGDARLAKDDVTQFFRAWLVTEMRFRNIRAEQLARCSQVHRSTISRLLRGERAPTLDTVARLSAALGIDLAENGPWTASDTARSTKPC